MAPQQEQLANNQVTSPPQVHTSQPNTFQSMTIEPPTNTSAQNAQREDQEMRLRGGEACPGRFCFIIPCPFPCNFCII